MSFNPVGKRLLEEPQLPDSKKEKFEPVSISKFPAEVIKNIFIFLSIRDLGRVNRVCKTWQQISNAPYLWQGHYDSLVRNKTYKPWKKLQAAVVNSNEDNRKKCVEEWIKGPYPKNIWDMKDLRNELFSGTTAMGLPLTSFLKKDWEQIVTSEVTIPDEPQLDPRSTLKRMYAFQKIMQGPFTLLMIPKDFAFKNIADESRFMPSQSSPHPIGHYQYFCFETIQSADYVDWAKNYSAYHIVNDTMIVLIGHDILPESVNKTMEEQQQMLTQLGCQMPSDIIVGTLLFLHLKGMVAYHALGYTKNYPFQTTRCTNSFPKHIHGLVFTDCHRNGEKCRVKEDGVFKESRFTMNLESKTKKDPNLGVLPMMILYP